MRRAVRLKVRSFAAAIFMLALVSSPTSADDVSKLNFQLPPKTDYRTTTVLGHTTFYREAGDPAAPILVLLHGHPSASHPHRHKLPPP